MISGRGGLGASLEGGQIFRGALRLSSGGKNRPLVFLKDRQPVADVSGVVVAVIEPQAEIRAQESRAQFRYEFFAGVTVIAKTLAAEVTVEP